VISLEQAWPIAMAKSFPHRKAVIVRDYMKDGSIIAERSRLPMRAELTAELPLEISASLEANSHENHR
jgi:hypothetical protein